MFTINRRSFTLAVLALAAAGSAAAQGLPTSQPNLLTIIREEVKFGHAVEHGRTEAGWPAAFERAKSPDYYVALTSLTGVPEAWFLVPAASHAAYAETLKRENDDPVLAAELARLSKADSEHVTSTRTVQAVAMKELSMGAFPDVAKQRFWEITIFRVRPGHEGSFAAAAKAYGAAGTRANTGASYRVYEVIAGMPGPTYVIITSVAGFGEFDAVMSRGDATMKAATAEEGTLLQKFMSEGVVNVETQRFKLDPEMSYVPKEVRAQDPAFWMPKKTKPAPKPTQP